MTARIGIALTLASVAAAFTGTAAADVSQTPVATGCPTGFEHRSVASFEAEGPYRLPRLIDTSGNNNNGFICALAFPEAACLPRCGTACPVTVLYLFSEDANPAQVNAQVGD